MNCLSPITHECTFIKSLPFIAAGVYVITAFVLGILLSLNIGPFATSGSWFFAAGCFIQAILVTSLAALCRCHQLCCHKPIIPRIAVHKPKVKDKFEPPCKPPERNLGKDREV